MITVPMTNESQFMSETIEAQRDTEYWKGSYYKSSNRLSAVTWNPIKTIKVIIFHFPLTYFI